MSVYSGCAFAEHSQSVVHAQTDLRKIFVQTAKFTKAFSSLYNPALRRGFDNTILTINYGKEIT
jgi:type IV secretory pathway ATPase VirB11/archaellum biosynthesis ATPase